MVQVARVVMACALPAQVLSLAIQHSPKNTPLSHDSPFNNIHELAVWHECDDAAMKDVQWGVYVDGRDAPKGADAYGEGYNKRMDEGLVQVHELLQKAGPRLRLEDWKALTSGQYLRKYHNPVRNEVRKCQKDVFKTNHREVIFKGITVMDGTDSSREGYKDVLVSEDEAGYDIAFRDLFASYNDKISKAETKTDKLHAISYLMRNLAYLHPLADQNGRSRVLLTQYELRRNHIGCGTMMFNNNKDIYFQTEEEFVGKLKEGLKMYAKAEQTGRNPWTEPTSATEHFKAFPNPYKDKLDQCWHQYCNTDWNDTTVAKHKACTGTAIALMRTSDPSHPHHNMEFLSKPEA